MLNNQNINLKLAAGALALVLAVPILAHAQTAPSQQAPNATAPNAQAQPGTNMRMPRMFGRWHRGGEMSLVGALADVTGLSLADIRTQLQAGKTLTQIAESKGKTATDVVNAARKTQQTALDQAVTNGRITREQADAKLKAFDTAAPDAMKSTTPGGAGGFMRGGCGDKGDKMDGGASGGISNHGRWPMRIQSSSNA